MRVALRAELDWSELVAEQFCPTPSAASLVEQLTTPPGVSRSDSTVPLKAL